MRFHHDDRRLNAHRTLPTPQAPQFSTPNPQHVSLARVVPGPTRAADAARLPGREDVRRGDVDIFFKARSLVSDIAQTSDRGTVARHPCICCERVTALPGLCEACAQHAALRREFGA